MVYYISAPETIFKPVKERLLEDGSPRHYLLSFATSSRHFEQFYQEGLNSIMIDSGAFSAWNSGKTIDREAYLEYCKKLPSEVIKINLDVIPKTGSSQEEKLICIEQSFENYLYLKKHLDNVIPVHHYGEDIAWAKKMLEETDYICISPANDTHESIKREYFKYVFSELPVGVKTHTLGYSSTDGMDMFPFYSLDSISHKMTHMHGTVLYLRSDGSFRKIDIGDYAKLHGFSYNPAVGLSKQRDLLEESSHLTIINLLNYVDFLTEKHLEKDFGYIKQQLKLF